MNTFYYTVHTVCFYWEKWDDIDTDRNRGNKDRETSTAVLALCPHHPDVWPDWGKTLPDHYLNKELKGLSHLPLSLFTFSQDQFHQDHWIDTQQPFAIVAGSRVVSEKTVSLCCKTTAVHWKILDICKKQSGTALFQKAVAGILSVIQQMFAVLLTEYYFKYAYNQARRRYGMNWEIKAMSLRNTTEIWNMMTNILW